MAEHVTAGYFEGDVRVFVDAVQRAAKATSCGCGPSAVLLRVRHRPGRAGPTVVFHTTDAKQGRAGVHAGGRRAAAEPGRVQGRPACELTTSAFATPTFGLGASRACTSGRGRQRRPAGGGAGRLTQATDLTLNAFGVPVPVLRAGGVGHDDRARGSIFRGDPTWSPRATSSAPGPVFTDWGLFETLGVPVPHGARRRRLPARTTTATRGPGAGVNGSATTAGTSRPMTPVNRTASPGTSGLVLRRRPRGPTCWARRGSNELGPAGASAAGCRSSTSRTSPTRSRPRSGSGGTRTRTSSPSGSTATTKTGCRSTRRST